MEDVGLLQVFELLVGEVRGRGGAEAAAGGAWRGGTAGQPGRDPPGAGSAAQRSHTGLSPGTGQALPTPLPAHRALPPGSSRRPPPAGPAPPATSPRAPSGDGGPAARPGPAPLPAPAGGRRHRLLHRGGGSEPRTPPARPGDRGAPLGAPGAARSHWHRLRSRHVQQLLPCLGRVNSTPSQPKVLRRLKAPINRDKEFWCQI